VSFGDTVGSKIAVSKRASKTVGFPAATAVAELDTGAAVAEPNWLSADGCRLYLTYTAAGAKTAIFVATRPK